MKKNNREGLEEAQVELAMEADKARENKVKKIPITIDEPSQFEVQIEEHSQRIKERQKEAERLKSSLMQMNKVPLKSKALRKQASRDRSVLVRNKVRVMLAEKSNIKAAFIAGEILAQPLGLRAEMKLKSY